MSRFRRAVRFVSVALMATGPLLVLAPLRAVTPVPGPDVAVVVADQPDPVVAKSKLTYTISVTNVGLATAIGAKVHDVISTTQSYISSHTTQGTCAFTSGSFDCALGDLAPGVTATVRLAVKELGTLQDSTTVSVSTTSTDPVPTNNTTHALTMVQRASPSASASGTPSHSPKPHKSPKPSRSASASATATATTFAPGPSGSSSAALPIMGAVVAALGFVALAGFFAWREHRTP